MSERVKLTEAQAKCLLLACESGALVSVGGGFWVSAATSEASREALRCGIGPRESWPAFVGTTTVYACERAGWLTSNETLPNHLRARLITASGRAAIASKDPTP